MYSWGPAEFQWIWMQMTGTQAQSAWREATSHLGNSDETEESEIGKDTRASLWNYGPHKITRVIWKPLLNTQTV